jgi:selenide,water dikinase
MVIKLTTYTSSGGCAGKISPGILAQAVQGLSSQQHENLLVGISTSDDAGVYKLDQTTALVQTVDFFGPMVDDPYTFGQIAAANSVSDIYAMGGKPITALNIVAFPICKLGPEVLAAILKGGETKLAEAGAIIIGGHTVENPEPKYGLSLTGLVHPQKIWTNSGAQPGDLLILTKALGTGILTTAAKADLFAEGVQAAIQSMITLNRTAAEIAAAFSIHACTDITGFGLLGHTYEMAAGSQVQLELFSHKLPILPNALEAAALGLIPAAMYSNRDYFTAVTFMPDVPETLRDICYDPQTSGGLLFSVPESQAPALLAALKSQCVENATVIGRVVGRGNPSIDVRQ